MRMCRGNALNSATTGRSRATRWSPRSIQNARFWGGVSADGLSFPRLPDALIMPQLWGCRIGWCRVAPPQLWVAEPPAPLLPASDPYASLIVM